MHITFTKVRSGKKYKRYVRLVQSFRRPDGMPAQKVIANLGELSDREVANLRVALAANRKGKAVVVERQESGMYPKQVDRNIEYLDIAVTLEFWNDWDLGGLLAPLFRKTRSAMSAVDVTCILALQRCVAPGSKLSAQKWFPRTALPELIGVDPKKFNNSRVHRVLEGLDKNEQALQERLPQRYLQKDGVFAALFVDVTDAWFEGRGPVSAQRSRTKNGLTNRHKIGILLLCNEKGYPLRWKVLPGKRQDPPALKDLVTQLEEIKWAQSVPIVFDRAMGGKSAVAQLCESGLCFLTAARKPEIENYTTKLPTKALESLDVEPQDDSALKEATKKEARTLMVEVGMEPIDENLFLMDLGVKCQRFRIQANNRDEEENIEFENLQGGASWLYKARAFERQLEDKVFAKQSDIAHALRITTARMSQIMSLLKLDLNLQYDVLEGIYGHVSESELRKIANMTGRAAQKRALDEIAEKKNSKQHKPIEKPKSGKKTKVIEGNLRLVSYFNPQMFVDQRITAKRKLQKLQDFVEDLNLRLKRSTRKRSHESILSEVDVKLRNLSMRSLCDAKVIGKKKKQQRVEVTLDEQEWQKRRRYDGFVLLLADEGMGRSARGILQLYRDKDTVERDFRTIKTDLKIRPVFHSTDPKVRAHVSICMLSLLLERSLEEQLKKTGDPVTAPSALETLKTCHLNVFAEPKQIPHYIVTKPDKEQRKLLERLGLSDIADPKELPDKLTPRPSF